MFVVKALRLYAPGLMAFALLKIVVPSFYALKDTKTPVKVGLAVLVLNVILNLILMQFMAERGLALSTTICAYINVVFLLAVLRKRMGPLGMRRVLISILRICIAATIMGAVVVLALHWSENICNTDKLFGQLVSVFVPLLAGLTVYTVVSFFSGQSEIKELLGALNVTKTAR